MELFIFSQDEQPLTVISEDTGLVETHYRIEVNSVPTEPFSFAVEADHPTAAHVKQENKVIFKDHEGDWRLMTIKEVDDSNGVDGPTTIAICEPTFLAELNDHIVVERRFVNQTADVALTAAVNGTRWVAQVEVELGQATTNFYYISSTEAIWETLNTWGGEFKDVVEFGEETNRIKGCYVKIIQRLGKEQGQRFEIDHNTTEIGRTVLSYPKTALYGRGSSLEVEDDEGEHTGGYTRYIGFEDVEWRTSRGDPVNKPLGQKWVGRDEDRLSMGYYDENGNLKHRFGIFSNQDYEDPEELLWATWEAVQKANQVEVNYRLSVNLFNEKVNLGDTSQAIDRVFARPIEIQTRIIALEYDLMDIENTMVVEMGQFLDLGDDLDDLRQEVENIKNNPPKQQITEGSYPDRKPSTPVNLEAYGGMEVIQLYWDYADEMFIKHYEVYGSRTEDFVPDTQHLLWRGDVSAFSHTVGTDEVWYYRVRAVNYHGRPSDWSVQVRAATHRVLTEDIMWGPELAERMRELHRVSDIIGENGVDFDQISQEAKDLINQQARIYTDEEVEATRSDIMEDIDFITIALEENVLDLRKRADDLVNRADGVDDILYDYNVRIDETERGLEFKADSLEVDQINRTVEGHTTEIELLATGLSTKVEESFVKDAIEDIEIGGRNLVLSSNRESTSYGINSYQYEYSPYFYENVNSKEVTISVQVEFENARPEAQNRIGLELSYYDSEGEAVWKHLFYRPEEGENFKGRISTTVSMKDYAEDRYRLRLVIQTGGDNLRVANPQMEFSNKSSDYSQAPEDILSVQENHWTEITQNSRLIDLQAESITKIGDDISSAQASIEVMSEQITNRVTKTIFDNESDYLRKSIAETRNFAEGIEQTVSSIEIGSNNLIPNSKGDNLDGWRAWGNSGLAIVNGTIRVRKGANTTYGVRTHKFEVEGGKQYTLSLDIAANYRVTTLNYMYLMYEDGTGNYRLPDIVMTNANPDLRRYSVTITPPKSGVVDLNIATGVTETDFQQEGFLLSKVQIENGNMETPWKPAIEDTDQRMSNAESEIVQLADDMRFKVDVDGIVSEINLNREGIRLKGNLIHLNGLSLIDEAIIQNAHIADGTIERAKLERAIIGTAQIDDLAVTSAKIASVNADKINAATLQAITANMGTLTSGRLLSNNNNMDLNLNTGNLTMRNAYFTLGNGARIDFTNVSNRIQYRDTEGGVTRSSGFGVGKSLSGYPFSYSGTTGDANLNTLSPYYSGAIWNTTRAIADGGENSISGYRFQFRAEAVSFDKGLDIDFNGSPTIRPISGASYNYDLGNNNNMFNDLYIRRLRSVQSFDVRNVANINKGWLFETSESGGTMSIRGLNGGSYTYVLGDTESYNHFSYGYITNLRAPSSGNSSVGLSSRPYTFSHFRSLNVYGTAYAQDFTRTSDRRLKDNIQQTKLGLSFVNQLNPVDYTMIDSAKIQVGFIAQELTDVFIKNNYTNQGIVSEDGRGYLGISYTNLIAPTIKAIQELDWKLEEEINWQRIEYQRLNNETIKINDEIAQLRKEHREMKEEIKELREMVA
ncbi:phage tail spike protein [Oceanobacillus oncorhynchi]|uniref:phage tail spike protein n=1 Tax=Oceanobacillus oncorhynchi TaxID=545501 RepID=UPI0025A35D3D|nr:phage tail spike protein [Oceanobacillus oncorhynchi]MDM8100929.1 phage tail spike protein [Oceanobacillus oncorhynchi]